MISFISNILSTLINDIKEIMSKGIIDNNGIQRTLKEQYKRDVKLSTISVTKSNIKRFRQMDNISNNSVTTNPDLSVDKHNNGELEQAPNEMETPSTSEATPQIKEISAPIFQNLKRVNLIKGTPYFLQGQTAPSQIEGSEMSNAYKGDFNEQAEVNKVKYPIKVERIGDLTPELVRILYETKKMQELTHNYTPSDKDLDMLKVDTGDLLKNRVTGLDSEYGDFINMVLGLGLIFGKSLFHRINNPALKEELIKAAEQKEQEITNQFNQSAEIIEKNFIKDAVLCNDCNKEPIFKDGLCQKHWLNSQINKGQQEFNS